jgi:hypothetical protein
MRSIKLLNLPQLFIAIIVFMLECNANAASWYVRPSAAGSNTGGDWNNAWSLATIGWSSVHAGDTIWLAGGAYTGSNFINPRASGSSGNVISIKRVQATDSVPAAAPGWSSAFDSVVVLDQSSGGNHGLYLANVSYITVDGRVANGIKFIGANSGGSISADSGTITGFTITNCELVGPSSLSGLSSAPYGLNWAFGTMNNCLVDHCQIHQMCNSFREGGWNNFVVQYCNIHDLYLCNYDHNDICYTYDNNTNNVIWRYNTVYNSPSDGWLFESSSSIKNWYWYGNVVYNCGYSIIQLKGGQMNGGPNASYSGLYIYNNVLGGVNPTGTFAYINFLDGVGGTLTNVLVENNIFFNCENEGSGMPGVTSDYNAYFPATVSGVGWPSSELHSFVLSANPFVDPTRGNYHLTAAVASVLMSKGKALVADGFINVDMDGNTRGGSAGWGVGAYQSVSNVPLPPANLRLSGN